ncbi:MAG TPA: hypothetical protein VHK69_18825 [Chitinophagaceae bacterium]|jgi:hypothetical protein|nr:hypothetical protein [Chitinophagaceae bacterium]
MEEPFVLTVPYRDQEVEVEARLELRGYTHRFVVQVGDTEVWFERDEEGAYRALLPPDTPEQQSGRLDRAFLSAIAEQIRIILS